MFKKQRNEKIIKIAEQIKDKSLIFIDYQGINVEDFTQLRGELRSKSAQIKVFKNTLTLRAMGNLKLKPSSEMFTQMTATAIADPDVFMASSKDILNAEKNKKVKIKGGFFNGTFIDSELVRKYANIPNQQELYSILVATLKQIISNIVFVLEEIKEQKESQENQNT